MSDPLDDLLRSRLDRSLPRTSTARTTYNDLQPTFRRARRNGRIKDGVAGIALVAVALGTGGVIWNLSFDSDQTIVATASPAEPTDGAPLANPDPTDSFSNADGVPPTTVIDPSALLATTTSSLSSSSASVDAPTSITGDPLSTPTSIATAPTASSSTPPDPTTSTTSTPGSSALGESPESETIASGCGSIVVSLDDPDIALVDTAPMSGFDVDVKNDGPETVEVSFEGLADECEIKAEIRDGTLWTDISSD